MPYASLHEAFALYSDEMDDETTNAEIKMPRTSMTPRVSGSSINTYDLPDVIKEESTQLDPPTAFFALNQKRELQVPTNQSVLSPDKRQPAPVIGGGEGEGGECGDDHDCMKMINHILECEPCAKKMKRIMNMGSNIFETSGGIFEMNGKTISKIILYVIIVIMVIALYEFLNKIRKIIFG
jgi:hypothetical protein